MSTFMFINSNDRIYPSSSNPADFYIQINQTITDNPKVGISLEQMSLLNLEYGINSNNNQLVFRENDSAIDINLVLAPGNYNSTDFCTALKDALESSGSNIYSVTYDAITSKISIISTIPDTFRIMSGSLLDPLGMKAGSSFTSGVSSTYPINLSGSTYVDLCLNVLNRNIKSGSSYGRVFSRVPLDVPYGSLITYVNDSDSDTVAVSSDTLDELRVTLFDDKGKIFQLPENCVVSIVLRCNSI